MRRIMPNTPHHNPLHNGAELLLSGFDADLSILDDLYRHGDIDAAALALGDVWQQLPPSGQSQVVKLVRQLLTRVNASK